MSVLALAPITGCPRGDTATADASVTVDAEPQRRPSDRGEVHYQDRRLPVAPFVARDARMDLKVACRLQQDAARAAKQPEPPLCYGEVPEHRVERLRVEHREGVSGAGWTRLLQRRSEGAHLIVEPSGSLYQILDLGFAPRRDGAVQPGEVRILSGHAAAHARLVEALSVHFPDARVEVVEVPDPRASAPPGAGPAPGDTSP